MRLRFAGIDDCGVLAELHFECFQDCWDAESIADLLRLPGHFAVAGQSADSPELIGFGLARVAADEAEVLTICVVPHSRCKGVGRQILLALHDQAAALGADAIYLEVSVVNSAAIVLYKGLGYREAGLRPAYYRSASGVHDALILRRQLG
ncbi:MAG TPA: ribosomal-protein-alanine acetyltransferase [Alphaproteobacteria bacterium]|nr:ribosomal-protein-alanine acetyltransferase [Alphaproteobacteria bacterium]HAJ48605.1 ribosomal-protein-alanine acetyltransferase [Alphaproteobacteria bacterium]